MPIEYCISEKLDVLYARQYGRLQLSDYQAVFRHYLHDPLYKMGRPEFIDQTDLLDIDVGIDEVRALLTEVNAQFAETGVRTKTVICAPKLVSYGVSRMYETLAAMRGGIDVKVSKSETSALQELGLPYTSIDDLLKRGGFSELRQANAAEP